ncbi:hypothetical protein Ddye_029206 [Dipteronia dyeriana]|uniref:MULE transposase domain-containing protein n=1 Tax=Dipteronia dyeriana TaxID=168575 RepID=A0AAD9TF35_9ROSI|nr:hypothetical protein Ddye_029206 [Dipteronia dyeriana]
MFVSFEPQRVGFLKGYRPFIEVDGCHLKYPFGGVLLSVVSLDTNSGLFPLDVCICEKETQNNWEWFLSNLKVYLNYPEGRNLTFISDRQKGVITALEIHFPFAHRRVFCRGRIRGTIFGKKPIIADLPQIGRIANTAEAKSLATDLLW